MRWKEIEGTNGLYLISDDGKVFSVRTNKLKKFTKAKTGYCRVEICIDGKSYKELVHRLVAQAFIPNPNNYPIINHKDENPENNRVENLEWCTYEYNSNYGTCIERRVENTTYISGAENPRSKKVYRFTLDGELIAEYGSVGEAARMTGLNRKSIAKACCGKMKKYAETCWSYENKSEYSTKREYQFRKGAIAMYDMQGNLIKVFDSPKEIEADGLSMANIQRVCRGDRKSYKGYVFSRIED